MPPPLSKHIPALARGGSTDRLRHEWRSRAYFPLVFDDKNMERIVAANAF
jgi:hypothetical protein